MEVNYLFVAVLIAFLYFTIRGYKKGFLCIVVTFAGTIAIIILAKKAAPYISEYLINNTDTYQTIQEKITDKFADANLKYDNTIPENQTITINSYEVPDLIKDNLIINNTQEMYKALLVNIFEEYVSAYLASTAIKAMGFVFAFVVMVIAFKILLAVVDIISKIPILRGINEFIGGCLGFIEALIVIWVFFFVVVMFIGNDSSSIIFGMIRDSKLLTFLFNNNVLLGFIA